MIFAHEGASSAHDFFAMAAGMGFAMSGNEVLSRALIASTIPHGSEAEFFSFRQTIVCGTSWLGPCVFALAVQLTHGMRIAILSPVVFLAASACILVNVDIAKGRRQAMLAERFG